jgi:hypothetical protein
LSIQISPFVVAANAGRGAMAAESAQIFRVRASDEFVKGAMQRAQQRAAIAAMNPSTVSLRGRHFCPPP